MTPWRRLSSATLVLALVGATASAQTPRTDVPGYVVRFLGAGTPTAINATNLVTGFRDAGAARIPVVFDTGMRDLPVLPGTASCEPTDLNDLGVIVGACAADLYSTGRAVVWTPGAGGTYTVAALPGFAGDLGSSAAAVNNLGQIIGLHYYRLVTGLQVGAGVVWRPSGPPVELYQTYGLSDFPVDINDAGIVVAGQKRLDLTTGIVTDLGVPAGPPAYIFARTASVSANGTIAGTAVPATSSPQKLIRHRNGAWQVLGGWGSYDAASAANDAGTVVGTGIAYLGSFGSARQAVVWFDQMGALLYANDFLIESARDWIVIGAADLNGDASGGVANTGRIVGLGSNLVTGAYGAVLLEPAGALPVPNVPSGLTATPRPATWQQPYHAVTLSWTDTSRTDYGFRVERTVAGQSAWTEISRVLGPAIEDTSGTPGVTYDYRVRAIGLAGDSAPSVPARATFPAAPIDVTPPTVRFVAPTDGAAVSGTVSIVVDTTDDVGVSYIDVQYQPNMGLPQICSGSGNGATSSRLTCSWNTRGLTPGAYLLTAYASDAMGNASTTTISVQVGATTATMRVSSVSLSASTRRGVATVTGRVTVVDQSGAVLRNAAVTAAWSTPSGTSTATATTNRSGVATFTTTGGRGTYTLTVQGVSLAGYTFNAANSTLQGTVVVP